MKITNKKLPAMLILLTLGCGKGMNLGSTAIREEAVITLVDATLNSSSTIESHESNTRYSLKINATNSQVDSCDPTLGAGARLDATTTKWISVPYTPAYTHDLSQVMIRGVKNGLAAGDMYMEVWSDNGSGSPGAVIDTTAAQAVASGYFTYTFPNTPKLTGSTTYHLILRGDSNYNGDVATSKYFRWYHDINGECAAGNFSPALGTTNSGSSWANEANSAGKSLYIVAYANTYLNSSPYIDVNYNAGVPVEWDLSTFAPNENPGGEPGSILYDIGASTSATDPQYQVTGKSLSQVQASGYLSGEVLHIRVYLGSGSNLTLDAGIGEMKIDYYR